MESADWGGRFGSIRWLGLVTATEPPTLILAQAVFSGRVYSYSLCRARQWVRECWHFDDLCRGDEKCGHTCTLCGGQSFLCVTLLSTIFVCYLLLAFLF